MSRIDPHSYVDSSHPRTKHLKWKANVDFAKHVIDAESTLVLAGESSGTMDVDTKGLTIHSVVNESDVNVPYELGEEDAILGRRLRLQLPKGTHEVRIRYQTSPEAIALQWLTPEQTEGKGHPFLFSQCQAIHARTMLPVQDTPAVRISYSAEVTVPEPLSAVMSAGPAGTEAGSKTGTRTFLFEMPQPIPPYLMALAVGELESRDLSKRSRVWAEPATVDKAALGICRHRKDDRNGRAHVWPLRVGSLRHACSSSIVSLRRNGKPAHDFSHSHIACRRSLAGQRGLP